MSFQTVTMTLLDGFLLNIELFAVTLAGALPLGLLLSFCSMSRFKPLKWLTRTLVWIVRGTPLMLQLLILYYVPGVLLGTSPWAPGESGRFLASAIAFILNYAFYFSEIFRAGIEGVPKGQQEAGQVLGMTKAQIFRHITRAADVFPCHAAADGQAHRAAPLERGHHAGEGHVHRAHHLHAGAHLLRLCLPEGLTRLFRPAVADLLHRRVLSGF